jgi:hypothetical protein
MPNAPARDRGIMVVAPMKQSVFRELMLRDLGSILGCEIEALPVVFKFEGAPLPLKIGVELDVRARWPEADPARLSRWLRLWVSSRSYIREICFGGRDRFDLDGNVAGKVDDGAREHARRIIVANRRADHHHYCGGGDHHSDGQREPTLPIARNTHGVGGRPILSLPSLQRSSTAA